MLCYVYMSELLSELWEDDFSCMLDLVKHI